MPLFICDECKSIENTACSRYWGSIAMREDKVLCSACEPNIGKWHDKFPRQTLEEYLKEYPDGASELRNYNKDQK